MKILIKKIEQPTQIKKKNEWGVKNQKIKQWNQKIKYLISVWNKIEKIKSKSVGSKKIYKLKKNIVTQTHKKEKSSSLRSLHILQSC